MTGARPTIIVLAKSPVPGRVKTRLCPPCTPEEAARLARAALLDTLDAVMTTVGVRPLLALDGPAGDWLPSGIPTVAQRGRGLDERITTAFATAGGPALLVGMDTPQVTARMLGDAVRALLADGVDAVLGPSVDGGFWALGLRDPAPAFTLGVPMSTDRTGAAQHQLLLDHGLRVEMLDERQDVDTMADATAVARIAPSSRFASAVARLDLAPAASTVA